ncbi:type II toxin-antitoxin system RelE/ParE family toxin [Paenibacillaceae bacterium WGS1546]|uniref:type II toxin-antitoxin system RelE family toxin n=1 Tax=Cohnella sp. WGS1546 TaxID=3366810 RepID=UPI00372D82F7
MSYSIEIYKDALKYLNKLDKPTRTRIVHSLQILADNPYNPELDIKKMQGITEEYRLRVGNYRVIYTLNDNILQIQVIKIGSRGDVYKD